MKYIVSTISQTMCYPIYQKGQQNSAPILKKIFIKGMANVANPVSLQMTNCAWTEVSDADYEDLKTNAHFMRHMERGFLKILDSKDEQSVKDMMPRDNSAQISDGEYADGTDPRITESGNCQASCGRNNRIKGKKGKFFLDE